MSAHLARVLEAALRDVRSVTPGEGGDPLRLDLPPDQVDGAGLEPRAAAVLGTLYLLSELEQAEVVGCAELLSTERWNLEVHDEETASALEHFARAAERWPPEAQRASLYGRLFGAPEPRASGDPRDRTHPAGPPVAVLPAPANAAFEELLAGYCEAVLQARPPVLGRTTATLRFAGDRLRANLAPRQFGNTLLVAGPLVEQVQAALALLGRPAIAALLRTQGVWGVIRALTPDGGADIGRRVDRGQSGRTLVASCGYPTVPDLVDGELSHAADVWLTATGFDISGIGA